MPRPRTLTRAVANFERIRAQLGRLDGYARAAGASAMIAAVINQAADRYGAAATASWLAGLAEELIAEEGN